MKEKGGVRETGEGGGGEADRLTLGIKWSRNKCNQ